MSEEFPVIYIKRNFRKKCNISKKNLISTLLLTIIIFLFIAISCSFTYFIGINILFVSFKTYNNKYNFVIYVIIIDDFAKGFIAIISLKV
jgi:hypothetical protein